VYENLQLLADQLAADLGRSILIEDSSLRLLAASALLGVVDQSRVDSILLRRPDEMVKPLHRRYRIFSAREPVLLEADEELGTLARRCFPLRTGSTLHGFIWLIDEPPMSPEEVAQVESAAVVAARLFVRKGDDSADRGRLLNELVESSERVDRESAAARLLALGALSNEPPFTLVVLRESDARQRDAGEWVALSSRLERGVRRGAVVAGTRGAGVVAVLTAAAVGDGGEVADVLAGAVRPAAEKVAVGIAGRVDALASVGELMDNARYAAVVAARAPEFNGVADWHRLGGYALFQHVEQGPATIERLCPGAPRLLDPRHAMYRDTVETYLDTCGDAHETAQRLGVHRTTLYWRLNRAEQLMGMQLADASARLDLQLALRLAALLDAE